MTRITADTSIKDAFMLVVDENFGAMHVLAKVIAWDPAIGLLVMKRLDDAGRYGAAIWAMFEAAGYNHELFAKKVLNTAPSVE